MRLSTLTPLALGLAACQPPMQLAPVAPKSKDVSGSVMIDVAPKPNIQLVGTVEFELLGPGVGKGCATDGDDVIYWVGMTDLKQLGPDTLSRRAIAAAALDAVSRLAD